MPYTIALVNSTLQKSCLHLRIIKMNSVLYPFAMYRKLPELVEIIYKRKNISVGFWLSLTKLQGSRNMRQKLLLRIGV